MAAVKLIAWRLGPEALGAFSILRQAVVAASAMFITGGQTALVQGMSLRKGEERRQYVGTALTLLVGGALAVGATVMALSKWLAPQMLPVPNVRSALMIAALAVVMAGPTSFVFGVLNGVGRVGRLAIAQALNAMALATAVWLLLPFWQPGRMILLSSALASSQIPGLLIGGIFLAKTGMRFQFKFTGEAARAFASIAGGTFVAALMQGCTVLAIRSGIAGRVGLAQAGVFDVAWTVSMVYVMLILSAFSTYYLPTLATRRNDASEFVGVVLRTAVMVSVPLIVSVMVLRPLVITILYSAEFLSATDIMHWMLVGDFFKVVSFVLAMPMIAFGDMKAFLIGEVGWNAAMIIGSRVVLGGGYRMEWMGLLFALTYMGYLVYAWRYCAQKTGWKLQSRDRVALVSGLSVLAAAAVLTWSARAVSTRVLFVAIVGCAVHVLLVLGGKSPDPSSTPMQGMEAGV